MIIFAALPSSFWIFGFADWLVGCKYTDMIYKISGSVLKEP